jgi:hypothetical protein
MNKENTIGTIIIIAMNFVLFLYFLADTGSLSVLLRDVIFFAIIGVIAVFFGYFVKRWWLIFLGALGIFLIGIRALFFTGGINNQWLIDFAKLIAPLGIMEALAFSGSILYRSQK